MPEDVVICVLLFLPVMSLLRFKSVNKRWCAIIDSSIFTSQHLRRPNRNSNGNLLVNHRFLGDPSKYVLLSGENFDQSLCLDFSWQIESCLDRLPSLVASCNGIICLYDIHTKDLALWNPATKQFRQLPESPIYNKRGSFIDHGFSFDVKTSDYKVIRMADFNQVEHCSIGIYSLSTDSWRILDANIANLMTCTVSNPKAPHKDGTYCWIIVKDNQRSILTFDFSNEVFGTIPLPDVCVSKSNTEHFQMLSILDESIACFNVIAPFESGHFEVWVMNEFGVKDSWTKLYAIGPFNEFVYPSGFSKNGKFVLLTTASKRGLVLCDPVTQELKSLPFQPWQGEEVVLYQESLVSINREIGALLIG